MFKEFENVNFILHHNHPNIKIKELPNVSVEVGDPKQVKMK